MRTLKSTNAGCFALIALGALIGLGSVAASGQADQPPSPQSVTVDEVVHQLVEHNQDRASHLTYYASQRHYHLEYKGFPHGAEAGMDVEAIYVAPTKTFRVLSESGSPKLINHVLKKLLKGEQDAAAEQHDNALTPANYNFALLGRVTENGRGLYLLRVEPKQPKKFLFRGRIWVDADDYAVVRIEAEPSQSPSFWIRNTQICHRYAKFGQFWLPTQNTTVTSVRLGGIATLTIDFDNYDFQVASGQNSLLREQGNLR